MLKQLTEISNTVRFVATYDILDTRYDFYCLSSLDCEKHKELQEMTNKTLTHCHPSVTKVAPWLSLNTSYKSIIRYTPLPPVRSSSAKSKTSDLNGFHIFTLINRYTHCILPYRF